MQIAYHKNRNVKLEIKKKHVELKLVSCRSQLYKILVLTPSIPQLSASPFQGPNSKQTSAKAS